MSVISFGRGWIAVLIDFRNILQADENSKELQDKLDRVTHEMKDFENERSAIDNLRKVCS